MKKIILFALLLLFLSIPLIDAASKPTITTALPNSAESGTTITLTGTNFVSGTKNIVFLRRTDNNAKVSVGTYGSREKGTKIIIGGLSNSIPASDYKIYVQTSAGISNGLPFTVLARTPKKLTIISTPPGADVYIGSETTPRGQTPVDIDLTVGYHDIKLTKSGYITDIQTIFITQPTRHTVTLKPTLKVTSDPEGADVYIGSETTSRGQTPLELALPPATYTVRVEKSGYTTPPTQSATIEPSSTVTTILSFTLSPSPSPTPTASITPNPEPLPGTYLAFTLALENVKTEEPSKASRVDNSRDSGAAEAAVLEEADALAGRAPALSTSGEYTALLRAASPFPDFPDFGSVIHQQKFTFIKEIFPEIFGEDGITSERVAIERPVEVLFFPFVPNLDRLQILNPSGQPIGSFPVAHLSPCNSNGVCDNFESAISCPGDCGQCFETDLGNDLDYHQDTCVELDPIGGIWSVKHDRTRSLEEWVAAAYEEAVAEQPVPTPSPGPQPCNNNGDCDTDENPFGCPGDCFTVPFPAQQPPDPSAAFGSGATEPAPGGCDACDEFFTSCTSNICITSQTASICNLQRFQQCTDARTSCRTARQCSQQYTAPPGCGGCTAFYQDCVADACYGDGQASICNTDQISQCTLQRDSCRADRSCYTKYTGAPAGCDGCEQYYTTCSSTACSTIYGHSSTCNIDQISLCGLQRDACKNDRSCVDQTCQYIQGFGGSSGDSLCQSASAGTCVETTPGSICSAGRAPNTIFWAKCCISPDPLPTPSPTPSPTIPPCGNGLCEEDEDAATCMSDCPSLQDYTRTQITTYSCQKNKCTPTIRYCDSGSAHDGTCQAPTTGSGTSFPVTGRVTANPPDLLSQIFNFFVSLFGGSPAGMFSAATDPCAGLPTENDRIGCYQQNCLQSGDIAFCQQISFPAARDQALAVFATSRLQPAVCNDITDQQTTDHCLKAVTTFAKPEVTTPLTDTQREAKGEHFIPYALLDVFSAPEATLKVDSTSKGQTPQTLELAYANHLLKFLAAGYAPLSFPYTILQRRASVMALLQPVVGRLTITSTPAGATIFLNSRDRGQTPREVALAPGTYTLRLEKFGYSPYTHPIPLFVYAGQTDGISATLTSTTSTLMVYTNPAGAEVFLNTETVPRGTTGDQGLTLVLSPATYTVSVEKPGYLTPPSKSVTTQAGLQSVLNFNLQPTTGTLMVTSTITGATVFVNNENKGVTTVQGLTLTLPIGSYTVRVEKYGYLTPPEQTAIVESGLTTGLAFTLQPNTGTLVVYTNIVGASVFLGSESTPRGTTTAQGLTLTLEPGTYTVKVTKSGYRTPPTQSATVERGLQSALNFPLVAQAGTLLVKSNTQNADVYLGATKIGTTSKKSGSVWTLTKSGIKPGTYTVKVKKGSKQKSASAKIEDAKTKTITLNL